VTTPRAAWPLFVVACVACASSSPTPARRAGPAAVADAASRASSVATIPADPGATDEAAPSSVATVATADPPDDAEVAEGTDVDEESSALEPVGVAGVYAHAVASCASGVALVGGYRGDCALDALPGVGLWTGEEWTFLRSDRSAANPAPEPAARTHAVLAWDARRQRLVLFGGYAGHGIEAGTWEWDGASWTDRTTEHAPSPRGSSAMAYDAARGVVLLFGGRANGQDPPDGPLGDTWSWDGARWERLPTPVAPPARSEHAMAYDAARQQVVLFGGRPDLDGSGHLDDTWCWDGRRWSKCDPPTWPVPRRSHAMAYDARRQRVVLHGGSHSLGRGGILGDLWEWDGATWLQVRAPKEPPRREAHGLAWDPVRERILCAGGRGEHRLDDTWSWDGATWTQVAGKDWTQWTQPEEPPPWPRPRGLRTRHERLPGQPSGQAVAALRKLATTSFTTWAKELAQAPRTLQGEVGLELEARGIETYVMDSFATPGTDRLELALTQVEDFYRAVGGARSGELQTFQSVWSDTHSLPRSPRDPRHPWQWGPAAVGSLLRLRRFPRAHAVVPFVLVQRITDARLRRETELGWRDEWLAALRDPGAPADQRHARAALLFLLEEAGEVGSLATLLESPLVADRALAHLVAAAAIPELRLQAPTEFERAVWWAGGLLDARPTVELLEAHDARLAAWLVANAGRLVLDPATGRYAAR
jgi:hypothetical protein